MGLGGYTYICIYDGLRLDAWQVEKGERIESIWYFLFGIWKMRTRYAI